MNLTTLLKQTFFLITFLVIGWILIHFLAVFGLFLTLALPLLHLFFYPHIMCFWCKLKGGHHSLRHSLIDAALILVLTLLSLPIIYAETRLISYYMGKTAQVARVVEFQIPNKAQHPMGTIFAFPIEVVNVPSPVNVIQSDLSFDPTFLEVIDITTDNTFVEFLVQKEFDNNKGYVRLTGGVPNPGYSGSKGILGTVYFKSKKVGATELKYLDTSLVLANNGSGDNLLADYPSVPIIITPANGVVDLSTDPSLKIKDQVQGQTDKTVVSFSEYAHELPKPYEGVEGAFDNNQAQPTLTMHSSATDTSFWSQLHSINLNILGWYTRLLK